MDGIEMISRRMCEAAVSLNKVWIYREMSKLQK
jgi:hypothetical protein